MKFDDVIKNKLVFSFSSLSLFDTCSYAWKLTYMESEERIDNFFSDFGKHVHEILEKYWNGKLKLSELADTYIDTYSEKVVCYPPPYPPGMADNYKESGLSFFRDHFSLSLDEYEPLIIEGTIKSSVNGIPIVVKPDLLLRDRTSGKTILFDYKTSNPKKNKKWDKNKIAEYEKQLRLYAFFIEKEKGIKVDKVIIIFVRLQGELYPVTKTDEEMKSAVDWMTDTVAKIKAEDKYPETISAYFCQNLCSVRNACVHWKGSYGSEPTQSVLF